MSRPVFGSQSLSLEAVPFVLATPHHAAPEVVAQIHRAVELARGTAVSGATPALGQPVGNAAGARTCGPKVPPLA